MSDQSTSGDPIAAFGPNEWLVDELYQQFLTDKTSVDKAWWGFFEDYRPGEADTGAAPSRTATGDGDGPQTTSAPAGTASAERLDQRPAARHPRQHHRDGEGPRGQGRPRGEGRAAAAEGTAPSTRAEGRAQGRTRRASPRPRPRSRATSPPSRAPARSARTS